MTRKQTVNLHYNEGLAFAIRNFFLPVPVSGKFVTILYQSNIQYSIITGKNCLIIVDLFVLVYKIALQKYDNISNSGEVKKEKFTRKTYLKMCVYSERLSDMFRLDSLWQNWFLGALSYLHQTPHQNSGNYLLGSLKIKNK